MDKFIEFMQNAWVIGIAGGTISGIIVYYITVYVLDRKKKSDYKRNIAYANNAVLDILRPYIANSGLPNRKELEAIINSISRQYGVKHDEMNSISTFYEDLVLEFIGNLYIPDEVKRINIEKLLENIDTLKNETVTESNQAQVQVTKGKTVKIIGILVGTSSVMISILAGAIASGSGKGSFNLIVGIISAFSVIITMVLAVWSYLRTIKRSKIYRNHGSKIKDYVVDRDYLRMENCGTDMNDSFNDHFSFINYFKEDE